MTLQFSKAKQSTLSIMNHRRFSQQSHRERREKKISVKHLMSRLLCNLLPWSGQNNLIMLDPSFKTSAKAAVRRRKSAKYTRLILSEACACVCVCTRACVVCNNSLRAATVSFTSKVFCLYPTLEADVDYLPSSTLQDGCCVHSAAAEHHFHRLSTRAKWHLWPQVSPLGGSPP